MSTTIEQLELEIQSSATSAVSGIDALASSLGKLKSAVKDGIGLTAVSKQLTTLPTKMQRLTQQTDKLSTSNGKASLSYINLAAKISIAVVAMKRIVSVIGGWITKSNEYIETVNLFSVSLGEYATEAKKYADEVADVMGIDPENWMRNQGVFMTLATGFGVAGDRAYTMSKNLTQLGYDLSSFFNISYDEAFQKLQSGLAGELEPLRRIGYDLSVARLQQEAYNLGITKSVNAMTQAEKAELRYYAIMTQVTTAQGDMARTLDNPANQFRILKEQVVQAGRALGNIFLPIIKIILPYAIALAKAVRVVAEIIAKIFKVELPEVGGSTLSTAVDGAADGAGDLADNLGDAVKKAKEVKNALLGIDELNIISTPDDSGVGGSGSGGSGVGGSGGLGFELPTYNFIKDAVTGQVDEILRKMKEWLGLTEDIDTWSEFFHTRLGRILTTVGAIGVGLATWKISRNVLSGLQTIATLKEKGLGKALDVTLGISLVVTGITLEGAGIADAIQNELNGMNFSQIIAGGSFISVGGALIGKAFGQAIVGSGIGAVVAGIPAMILGIYDSLKNGISWLSGALTAAGATAAGAGIGAIVGSLGGPLTAGLGALIGLGVGLVIDGVILVVQKWDEIKESLDVFFTETIPGIWEDFTGWFGDKWQAFKDFDFEGLGYDIGHKLGSALKTGWDFITEKIPEWLAETWDEVKESVSTFFTETLPEWYEKVSEFFHDLPGKIKEAITNAWEDFKEIGSAILDGIWEGLSTIGTKISEFAGGFVQGFKDALGIHSPSTVFCGIGGDIVAGLSEGIEGSKETSGTVSEWASQVVEFFTSGTDGKGIVENFKEIGGGIVSGFGDKIGSTYTDDKSNVISWASSVKSWFSSTASSTAFSGYANDIINGFKNKIGSSYTNAKSNIQTFASKVKSWFTDDVSYDSFYSVASDVINGFKNGIGNLYNTCKDTISSWGSNTIEWFKGVLGIHSPSTEFFDLAAYTIEGFNNGFRLLGKSTKGVVSEWAKSFTAVTPTMSFAVDTSALKYYDSSSFSRSVSADVTRNTSVTATGFIEGMEEFYREYVEPTIAQMASDVRRQADKKEQTIVQIGNRTVSNAVTTQQKANGFVFAK